MDTSTRRNVILALASAVVALTVPVAFMTASAVAQETITVTGSWGSGTFEFRAPRAGGEVTGSFSAPDGSRGTVQGSMSREGRLQGTWTGEVLGYTAAGTWSGAMLLSEGRASGEYSGYALVNRQLTSSGRWSGTFTPVRTDPPTPTPSPTSRAGATSSPSPTPRPGITPSPSSTPAPSPTPPTPAPPPVRGCQQVACQPSGAGWAAQFPTSRSTVDLKPAFGAAVDQFAGALRAAGATVQINATRRPPERAYLMYYAWRIAREGLDPARVPARAGVAIDWLHRDAQGRVDWQASQQAAEQMVRAYEIVHSPALASRHTQGRALDMTITWEGDLTITLPDGTSRTITSTPRNGADNPDLHAIGAAYGVRKLLKDAPHWSEDGR